MQPNHARIAHLHSFAAAAGLVAMAIGSLTMLGWIVQVDTLKSLIPGLGATKANTALVLILLGGALHAANRVHADLRWLPLARIATAFAFLVSLTVLSQYLHGVDLGVDQLLFTEPRAEMWAAYPGRIAPSTGICFILLATALFRLQWRVRGEEEPSPALGGPGAVAGPVIGIVVFALALLGLGAYLTSVTTRYGFPNVTLMALPTAIAVLLLGAGLTASRPEHGPMRLLTSDGVGGALVRHILPASVLGIPVLATLRLVGQEAGVFDTAVGTWLLSCAFLALLIPVVWRAGWSLERADAERRALAGELKRLSERDPLTGLYNRRRLDEEMVRQLAGVSRHGRPFAVLAIDLDAFKLVNDTSGHAAGDALLVEVAFAIKRHVRTSDYVARFGGDEFVVLLPETDAEAAAVVADKLLVAIRAIRLSADEHATGVTASVGALTCVPPADAAWTPESVLGAADRELYAAKAAGRDTASHRVLSTAPLARS